MNPAHSMWSRTLAWIALVSFAFTTLVAPVSLRPIGIDFVSGQAFAQMAGKDQLAIIALARRDGVGTVATARIEEYLRAMIEAGSVVQLTPQSVVKSGRPKFVRSARATQRSNKATKNLAKADQALLAARVMIDEKKNLKTAAKLLSAAIKRYERYFVELVDFTKLVDAYARASQAQLMLGKRGSAATLLTKAVVLQPTLVTNRGQKKMHKLLTVVRGRLAKRKKGTIQVECKTPGAEVYVDGVKLGSAPAVSKDLDAGTHYVQVRHKEAEPWGKSFTVRGRRISVNARLEMMPNPKHNIHVSVQLSKIAPFAQKGGFHTRRVRNYSLMFSRQIQARYLLYAVVSKNVRGLELHMFLFDSKAKKFAALDMVPFNSNLSNMQMKILEAEGHIRRAIQAFPSKKEVVAQPAVYTKTRAAAGAPAIVRTPPPLATTTPTTRPSTTPPSTTPPSTTPPSTTAGSGTPAKKPVSPSVRPTAPTYGPATKPKTDPYAGLLKNTDQDKSIVKTWWFWTALGAVVAGGVATAVILSNQTPEPSPNFKVDARVQP
ncbi:MAG: PEGA domain-containing protein [Myxococcales bacterium]|nr:PEGA domain-containing protein [Myxococcales bacterium]